MDNVRGIGGITPPSKEPLKPTTAPKGNADKYDPSKDAFHNKIIDIMGSEAGERFWGIYTKSVQEACRKAIQKAQQRATQALKEAKNV